MTSFGLLLLQKQACELRSVETVVDRNSQKLPTRLLLGFFKFGGRHG
jgi:hypothetical protein